MEGIARTDKGRCPLDTGFCTAFTSDSRFGGRVIDGQQSHGGENRYGDLYDYGA